MWQSQGSVSAGRQTIEVAAAGRAESIEDYVQREFRSEGVACIDSNGGGGPSWLTSDEWKLDDMTPFSPSKSGYLPKG